MAALKISFITFLLVLGLVLSNPSPKHGKSKKSKSRESRSGNDLQDIEDEGWEYENRSFVDTRRILYGRRVPPGKRPYMVYLQLTQQSAKIHKYKGWLCGGVIVHPEYVLTSAACVEDAEHFYIVSGTTKFVESTEYKSDTCVCKHRRKVIWKCIPKNYKYDFQDSLKWSANDIAIVKVDRPFKLGQKEPGCQFATDLVCYNNVSRALEKAGSRAWIAGWGSMGSFREGVYRRSYETKNAKCLQEAKVCTMDNEKCANKWAQKFRSIINEYMVCTKDVVRRLSEICDKKYANCTEVENRRKAAEDNVELPTNSLNVDLGRHLLDPNDYTARRSLTGGFCENDHGGPLLVTYQNKERVIGVMSACKIDAKSHSCHGPFLYTSIFKNRQFLSCAIYKDVESNCRRVFRSGITHEEYEISWDNVKEDDTPDVKDRKDDDDDDDDKEDRDDDDDDDDDDNERRSNKSDKSKNDDDDDDDEDKKVEKSDSKKKSSKRSKKKKSDSSSDSSSSSTEDRKEKKKEKTKEKKKEKKKSTDRKKRRVTKHDYDIDSTIEENVNEPTDL